MEIETPVLFAYVIDDSTDIFRISGGGGFEHPKPPLSVRHCILPPRLVTGYGATLPTVPLLMPSDVHLVGQLKKHLPGKQFAVDADMQ